MVHIDHTYKRFFLFLCFFIFLGLSGCCFVLFPEYRNVIDIGDGRPRSYEDRNHISFVDLDFYSRKTVDKDFFYNEVRGNIFSPHRKIVNIKDHLIKEGAVCNLNICKNHYCTWSDDFDSSGFLNRESPRYCVSMTINIDSCSSKLDSCVVIDKFSIEKHHPMM